MKRVIWICAIVLLMACHARAVIYISEIMINPPGSSADDTREFIELQGPPGMKLDGYAIAFCNGTQSKFYFPGAIVTSPHEIDEFFSLDGLELGENGIFVLGIGFDFLNHYPTLVESSFFRNWGNIWNGGLDSPGKLQNDGSNTILLIRNRPGRTEANPAGQLLWGKDISHDTELITPVEDPPGSGDFWDQWGDGNVDRGGPDGQGGFTLDLKGATTPESVTDDLEIVDEVSYEHDRGWEYDLDGRHVDAGSTVAGLPYRHVHALDDPQGLNPDCLTRVDYRTTGPGYAPAAGGVGEMGNGNNWQDTATEQWIRGETVVCLSNCPGDGDLPQFFFDNGANDNPDSIQPYLTNVPLWLDDNVGNDYDFSELNTYQIMAGRVNPLAVPFNPGDVDRDGDCDADDVAKLASVFGNDDWIFSNSFSEASEGDEGDPATQIRPWDVNLTGDNGIDPSDLQWVLNFQGDATGRIQGRFYDSEAPSPDGVIINYNTNTAVTISTSVYIPSGHSFDTLEYGEVVELTVLAEVTGAPNPNPGEENGVMQFVHDLALSTAGVLRVDEVTALGNFLTTRASIQQFEGTDGDLGMSRINGYTTSFLEGIDGPTGVYKVTLLAIGVGETHVSISSSADAKFAASTPFGVKLGHIDVNGDPAFVDYPQDLPFVVLSQPGDMDGSGDVTIADWDEFYACMTGPDAGPVGAGCVPGDFDLDGDVDLDDASSFMAKLAK